MSSTHAFDWMSLPAEMKLNVFDHLSLRDVWACALTSRSSYSACLPLLFKSVNLPSLDALLRFLEAVPPQHCALVRNLSISTASTRSQGVADDQVCDDQACHALDAFTRSTPRPNFNAPLATLLERCTSLEALALSVCGTLDARTILPVFKGRSMERVQKLKLENLELEEISPLSERLVVSLAFALPALTDLSVTRITRSALHAPELLCSNVPVVQGDNSDDVIPPHPLLGHELRLPQLLHLPNLKQLKICDTHLGDPMWAEDDSVACPLEVLDLGSCPHLNPKTNEMHIARILARAPPSITSCALGASLPTPTSSAAWSPISPICKSPASPFAPSSPTSPLSANSSTSSLSSLATPIAETQLPLAPLPRLQTLHLTPHVPTSALHATLSQPALAGSPVHTLSCAFHPDDAAEGCEALEAFLRERAARSEMAWGQKQGRGRAASKLGICTQLGDDGEESTIITRTRANTTVAAPSVPPSASSLALQTEILPCLYPSLSTLTVDIPSPSAPSPLSPTGKLSPRRLAAARRRAEERRTAALRLRALAKELGLEILVRGLELDVEAAVPVTVQNSAAVPSLRARANSA